MTKTAILAVLPLVFSASTAFAEATDEGALHLTEVFQTYLGSTEGVVSVEVDGDSYALTIDAAPLTAAAAAAGGTANVTPLELSLTDNGDGTWAVSQDQAISIALTMPGAADIKIDVASFKSEGTFDEALQSFANSKTEMTDIKVTEKITDPKQGEMAVDITMASGSYETAAVAGAAGGVDNTLSLTMNGLTETMMTPAQDGMPAMPITVTADTLSQTGKIDGFRPDAFYKALAWAVAHPTPEAAQADKAAMKTILTEGLPFFATMASTSSIKNMAVTTPMGNVGMAEMKVDFDLNGAVADGKVREAITVTGLSLPEALIPAWAVPILPKDVSLDFQVTDYDAAAAANVLLGLFDLPAGTQPDAAFEGTLLSALMPKGTVTIELNPGAVTGDGYSLTYTGSMVAGPNLPIPTGKATVTLTGIEKLQAALGAAPDDIKGQAMMGIGMAQGMAKPGANGELVWEIDASTPGAVSVNGTPLMGGN